MKIKAIISYIISKEIDIEFNKDSITSNDVYTAFLNKRDPVTELIDNTDWNLDNVEIEYYENSNN